MAEPTYEANPNDSVGALHNFFLDQFLDWYLEDPKEPDSILIENYFSPIVWIPENWNEWFSLMDQDSVSPGNYSGQVSQLFESYPEVFYFYHELSDIALNTSLSAQEMVLAIIQLEESLDRNGLTSIEIEAINIAASVARHSLVFWAPAEIGGMNNCTRIVFGGPIDFCWGCVGRTDIWGALGSALLAPTPITALGGGVISSAIKAGEMAYYEYLH